MASNAPMQRFISPNSGRRQLPSSPTQGVHCKLSAGSQAAVHGQPVPLLVNDVRQHRAVAASSPPRGRSSSPTGIAALRSGSGIILPRAGSPCVATTQALSAPTTASGTQSLASLARVWAYPGGVGAAQSATAPRQQPAAPGSQRLLSPRRERLPQQQPPPLRPHSPDRPVSPLRAGSPVPASGSMSFDDVVRGAPHPVVQPCTQPAPSVAVAQTPGAPQLHHAILARSEPLRSGQPSGVPAQPALRQEVPAACSTPGLPLAAPRLRVETPVSSRMSRAPYFGIQQRPRAQSLLYSSFESSFRRDTLDSYTPSMPMAPRKSCAPLWRSSTIESACAPVQRSATKESACAPVQRSSTAESACAPVQRSATKESACAPVQRSSTIESACTPVQRSSTKEAAPASACGTEPSPCKAVGVEASPAFADPEIGRGSSKASPPSQGRPPPVRIPAPQSARILYQGLSRHSSASAGWGMLGTPASSRGGRCTPGTPLGIGSGTFGIGSSRGTPGVPCATPGTPTARRHTIEFSRVPFAEVVKMPSKPDAAIASPSASTTCETMDSNLVASSITTSLSVDSAKFHRPFGGTDGRSKRPEHFHVPVGVDKVELACDASIDKGTTVCTPDDAGKAGVVAAARRSTADSLLRSPKNRAFRSRSASADDKRRRHTLMNTPLNKEDFQLSEHLRLEAEDDSGSDGTADGDVCDENGNDNVCDDTVQADTASDSEKADNPPAPLRRRRLSLRSGAAIAKKASVRLLTAAQAFDHAVMIERREVGQNLLQEAEDMHDQHARGTSPPPLRKSPTGSWCLVDDSEKDRALVQRLFFDSMPKEHVRMEGIQSVINLRLLSRFLKRVNKERAYVEATFHGTRPECADHILKEGLLTDVCSTAAYGVGAYVGTHAGVAHQYADPDPTGLRFMCVVLVVVGRDVVRGVQGKQSKVTSVDRLVNPTQYCLVDEDRLLVSHLISYRVVDFEHRRVGGGWDDPFQRRLAQAIRNAGVKRKRKPVSYKI